MHEIYTQGRCTGGDFHHLFFSERPDELARAQALCAECPVQLRCLESALERKEEWGVWGGVIFWDGQVFWRRRGRGRPRKVDANRPLEADRSQLWRAVKSA